MGQLAYEVSFEGVVTAYRYDNSTGGEGRLAAKYYYDGPTAESDYLGDAVGGWLTEADDVVTYTYDAHGRQTEILQQFDNEEGTFQRERQFTNTYDAHGRMASISTEEGETEREIHYEYDSVTAQHVRTWTWTSQSMQDDPITDTRYSYDTLGRLDDVTVYVRNGQTLDPQDREVTDYFYDLLGNLDEVHLPNGVTSDYVYDDLNRLTSLTHKDAADQVLAQYGYELLDDGRRSAVTEIDQEGSTTRVEWLYDDVGRLLEEHFDFDYDPQIGFEADRSAQYTFDLVGNRLVMETDTTGDDAFDETVNYEYDANDRLLTEKLNNDTDPDIDQTTTYTYYQGSDPAEAGPGGAHTVQTGKVVWQGEDTDPDTGTQLNKTTYDYNRQGRLGVVRIDSDADGNTNTQLEYEYDDSGMRVAQTQKVDDNDDGDFTDQGDSSERSEYVVDPQNPTGYVQVLEEWVDGALAKSYTLGLDVIAQALSAAAVHFFLYDGHGSTRALLDSDGEIAVNDMGTPETSDDVPQVFLYDAYGLALNFNPAAAVTSLLYSGEQLDQLTGLQYLRARYYDLTTGRFTRLDPFLGILNEPQSLHNYLYVHADPIQGIDPTGRILAALACGILSVTLGCTIGAWVRSKYDSAIVQAGVSIVASGLAYLGFIQLGYIARFLLRGNTDTVNIYVPPLGQYAGNPDFESYRRNVLGSAIDVQVRLNRVCRYTTFNIIDGAMPEGTAPGYRWWTKTINIRCEWRPGLGFIAQGSNWTIGCWPEQYRQSLQFWIDAGTIPPPTEQEKEHFLGNMMLHETAHLILDRSPVMMVGGWRDHKGSGVMAGGGMKFNEMKDSVHDYDEHTKFQMRAALGWDWSPF